MLPHGKTDFQTFLPLLFHANIRAYLLSNLYRCHLTSRLLSIIYCFWAPQCIILYRSALETLFHYITLHCKVS